MELMVQQMRVEAEDVLTVTLVAPDGEILPEWEPGAHIDVTLGDVIRQYSLCGSPADRMSYRVAVLAASASRGGSAYVHEELRPGHLIEVGGPRNHFELAEADDYLFIAGGIGITPIIPMIERAEAAGRSWHLVYGGRCRESMAFRGELERYGSRVTLVPQDEDGLIDLASMLGEPRPGTLVYACGPEPLLESVEELCAPWPNDSLHVERFVARAVDHDDDRAFEVICQSTGLSVRVEPGISIVDSLETVDVWIPTACREGICGTCETRVIEGTLDHRDSILTPEEQACGKTMMPCVSRCTSARLVLDL